MRKQQEIATVLLILESENEKPQLELELDVMTPLDSYRRLIERVTNCDTYGRILIFKHEGRPIRYIRDVLPSGTKTRVTLAVEYREWDLSDG